MPDDDPVALEAVLKYLYSVSPEWVNDNSIHSLPHGFLPEGYLQWLVEVFRLAEKYELALLAEQVIASFRDQLLFCPDCWKDHMSDEGSYETCIDIKHYPIQILQTLALCETLGESDSAHYLRHILYSRVAQTPDMWELLAPTVEAPDEPERIEAINEVFLPNPAVSVRMMACMARTIVKLGHGNGEHLTINTLPSLADSDDSDYDSVDW